MKPTPKDIEAAGIQAGEKHSGNSEVRSEFAERAGRVLAERLECRAEQGARGSEAAASRGAASGAAIGSEMPDAAAEAGVCALCGRQVAAEECVRPDEYRSPQRELLLRWIAMEMQGFDGAARCHRQCLQEAERRMQGAQLRRENGVLFFVDLSLGRTPILPTPMRMNADLRFTGRGVTIAFIDSGFYPHTDLTHPSHRLLAIYDAVRGREVRSIERMAANDPPVEAWHGTMAAATAAGSGMASGGEYHGIACESRLVLVKAMTRRYRIRTPQVLRALEWVRENRERFDIRVVNMSLGVDETTDSMHHPVIALVEELSAMGVVMVAASGNNPANPIKPPGAAPSAITVGGYNDHNSTEWMRREVWHSSYGNTPGHVRKPELLAPAIWVAAPILPRTAVKREADALFRLAGSGDAELMALIPPLAGATAVAKELRAASDPLAARGIVLARIAAEKMITADYKHVDGTSFAAPIVSSVVAQMLEARPDLTPEQVKRILCATAMPIANVPQEVQGYGVADAAAAVRMVLSLPGAGGLEPGMQRVSE
ncbi:MAG: S8 family serine peptidase [Bacteroidetes bacterium]|nr:S8 family serine peptidase [Bacteroidota bacterium]